MANRRRVRDKHRMSHHYAAKGDGRELIGSGTLDLIDDQGQPIRLRALAAVETGQVNFYDLALARDLSSPCCVLRVGDPDAFITAAAYVHRLVTHERYLAGYGLGLYETYTYLASLPAVQEVIE